MSYQTALAAVADAELAALADPSLPEDLRALARAALSRPGSVLARGAEAKWAALPLLSCSSASGGSAAAAVPLAVTVELQTAAYSLLDDLQDGDPSEVVRHTSPACALNVAITLLALAGRALRRVPEPAARVMADAWVGACAGQHRDLTLQFGAGDPLGSALLAAEGKTAGIAAAAAEAGALLGGADAELAARYRRFGHAVGMLGQFANDLLGLQPGPDGMSDVSRGRPTLPALFALAGPGAPAVRACLEVGGAGEPVPAALHARALDELAALGAHRYLWALLGQARREAVDALEEIARFRSVAGTLDRLLSPAAE